MLGFKLIHVSKVAPEVNAVACTTIEDRLKAMPDYTRGEEY